MSTYLYSINPYTQEQIASYKELSAEEVKTKLDLTYNAYLDWRNTNFDLRNSLMLNLAKLLEEQAKEQAELIVKEMGKPLAQAIAEVKKCALVCRYYAENAETILQTKYIQTEAAKSYVRYEPMGIVLGIMPWNFPFWQVFRYAAPALMAGNTVALKHASNVMGSAHNIEKLFIEAGFPENCFTQVCISSKQINTLVEYPKIHGIVLTGSEQAGRSLATKAGSQLKKTVLELGGSNAMIVLKDADIATAIEACIHGRFLNTGQSCIASKRLLLHETIAEEFIAKLKSKVENLKSGNPMEIGTYIGVLSSLKNAEQVEKQVQDSLAMGAELICGGNREEAYFEPTLISNTRADMPVRNEEVFGPVLPIVVFNTIEEAIQISNETDFGLGVSIFTQDIQSISKHIADFEEACVFVNDFVKSDPRLPFGGIKNSGYGRELGEEGILEFVNKKTIYIK